MKIDETKLVFKTGKNTSEIKFNECNLSAFKYIPECHLDYDEFHEWLQEQEKTIIAVFKKYGKVSVFVGD